MGRPGKIAAAIDNSVSHRTKADLEQREKAEAALLSGIDLAERPSVANNPAAHEEFLRVKALFAVIGKADDLYGAVCNRYCELHAEILDCLAQKKEFAEMLEELCVVFGRLEDAGEVTCKNIEAYSKQITLLIKQMNELDGIIMQKRKMMFDIEKENCMTVASSIRAIPKTAEKQPQNPILEALLGDDEEEEPKQITE